MAATLINSSKGLDFLQLLMHSEMLEVTFINDDDIEVTVRMPAVLACEFSERFDALCTMKHSFTAEEVLTTNQSQFESKCTLGHFEGMLSAFIAWLYTSSLHTYIDLLLDCDGGHSHADLWFFGQTIVAPKFQDAVLMDLCSRLGSEPTSIFEYITLQSGSIRFPSSAERVWEQADFSIDYPMGYDLEDNEVYFENKKFLLFFLDTLAYEGIGNAHVCSVITKGGPLVVQLMKRVEMRAKSSHDSQPPWHASNIGKYLIIGSEAQKEQQTLPEASRSEVLERSLDRELEARKASRRLQAPEISGHSSQLALSSQLPSPAPSNSNTLDKYGTKSAKSTSAISRGSDFKESRPLEKKRPRIFPSAQQSHPKQPRLDTTIKREHEGSLIQKYEESASMNLRAMADTQTQFLRRSASSETLRASSAEPA